jgi:hypothetical protein
MATKPNPRRSTTLLYLGAIPLCLLILAYGACLILYAIHSSAPKVQATPAAKSAPVPIAPRVAPDPKWPFIGGITFFLGFATFAILRRKQDFERFLEAMKQIAPMVLAGKPLPTVVTDTLSSLSAKLTGPAPPAPPGPTPASAEAVPLPPTSPTDAAFQEKK